MATENYLPDVLETTEPDVSRPASSFPKALSGIPTASGISSICAGTTCIAWLGKEPELVRTTIGGNGTTFDLRGKMIVCEATTQADAHRPRRHGRDAGRQLLGRALQPAERCYLPLERLYLFHRPGQAPPLSRARDTRPGRREQSVGRRPCLSAGAGRRSERAGALRISDGLALSAGRAHDVRREYALVAIHPCDPARRGRKHGRAQHLRRPQRGRRAGHTGRSESGQHRPGVLHRAGRHLGHGAGRRTHRIIRWPEQAVNFAFGGPDLRTLFCCAHTSVYALRVKVPGNPHPWYKRRGH